MGQIYLVRHGQASFGSANYDRLSELGLEQARLLGEWFADSRQRFSRVVTGSLRRHRQTADACIARLPEGHCVDTVWQTDPGFDEFDHHEVLIRYRPDFVDPAEAMRFFASGPQAKYAFLDLFREAMGRWMDGAHDGDYREPWPVFRSRCIDALQRLMESADKSEDIVVFTSGGTISTICQHLLGLSDLQAMEMNWTLVNCALTKLYFQPGRATLSYLNNYAHLERLGEPEFITYR